MRLGTCMGVSVGVGVGVGVGGCGCMSVGVESGDEVKGPRSQCFPHTHVGP